MKFAISSTATLVTMDHVKNAKEHLTSHPFPTRLFTMLEESQRRGFEDVIAWQPGGESFRVYKADRFAAEIAGDFFALRKYKSFLRQLNIYGFQRIHHGPNKGGYCHVLFQRQQPEGVKLISRQGESQRASSTVAVSPGTESPPQLVVPRPSTYALSMGASAVQTGTRSRIPSVDAAEFDPVKLLFSLGSGRHALSIDEGMAPLGSDSDGTATSSTYETISGSALHGAGDQQHSFPWKLHKLLEEAEREGFTTVVSWVQGGNAFKVHDSDAFVSRLMPNFFDQSKYESFRRQLNLYGFSRVTRGTNKGFISHPFFVRNNRTLCKNITRKGKEDGTAKEPSNEAFEDVAV